MGEENIDFSTVAADSIAEPLTDQVLVLRKEKLDQKEKDLNSLSLELDQKQAIISSKIAQNEVLISEALKSAEYLKEREQSFKLAVQHSEEKEANLEDKIKKLDEIKTALEEIAKREKACSEKEKNLSDRDFDIKSKEEVFDKMNVDFNIQKREIEAKQKRVQRLIEINKLESEIN